MNEYWSSALERTVHNLLPKIDRILSDHPYIKDYADRLTKAKTKVLDNLDDYIKMTVESVEKSGGVPHLVKDKKEAQTLVRDICGRDGVILFAKSNVALELGLREALVLDGHEVWETDLGEFLLQLAGESPTHIVIPALHMTKERIGTLLHDRLDPSVGSNSSYEDLVECVRRFLFQKYTQARVGITGANAVAAATGSVVLVENEGNIRMDTVMPSVHIAITGVEKIVPTLSDAFLEAEVQSAYAGLYPPAYIDVTSGPSSTADIESKSVSPATGPKEFHLILVDNGRTKAVENPNLRDALLCIKCGRCYFTCPVYGAVGAEWMKPPYGGPMGAMWSVILENDPSPANLCTHSGGCKIVCPVHIDIPKVLEYAKSLDAKRRTNSEENASVQS